MSEYIIKKGDSLSKIAKAHGTTVTNLVNLNKISNPDLIFPGQKIKINAAPYTHDKEHKIFMSEMSPEMIEKGNKILQYLKSNKMQYGGNILPYNTFSEYDKLYELGVKANCAECGTNVKKYMADLGYPNNTTDSPFGKYNDWEIADYEQILNNQESQIGNIFGKQAGEMLSQAGSSLGSSLQNKSGDVSSGVNSAFNLASTALSTFAPPDSKFGKAMNKGNQFAQVAEPLGMLDNVVPGLGTGLVQGARLIGAITGGIQAKNEKNDVKRMKKINQFNTKYNNGNYDSFSQGNFLAKYGITTKDDTSALEAEIFADFDMFLQQKK